MARMGDIMTTYSRIDGTEHHAVQLTWEQVTEILGHAHTGSAEDDARLIEALRSIGAPEWIEDAEGWTDEHGWGLIGPQVSYVELAPHSYHYCGYDSTDPWGSYGYTYIRKPDPTDRTVYADRPVTHIEVRPDVEIQYNGADGASVTWDPGLPCPFVRLDGAR